MNKLKLSVTLSDIDDAFSSFFLSLVSKRWQPETDYCSVAFLAL